MFAPSTMGGSSEPPEPPPVYGPGYSYVQTGEISRDNHGNARLLKVNSVYGAVKIATTYLATYLLFFYEIPIYFAHPFSTRKKNNCDIFQVL